MPQTKYLVINNINNFYTIQNLNDQNLYLATIRKKLKNKTLPKVGDFVHVKLLENNEAIIETIMPRKNVFVRPSVANIDKVFVIMSYSEPNFDANFVNKVLLQFEIQNIKPILIISKNDLNLKTTSIKWINLYKKMEYNVHSITNLKSLSWKRLKKYFSDGKILLVGKSGVGKSTIINNFFPELNLQTNLISKKLQQGKHTTRSSRLIQIDQTSWFIDTPGFSLINLKNYSREEITNGFLLFRKYSGKCKFNNCSHTNEPNCEIKNLVNSKIIPQFFYDSYLWIYQEWQNSQINVNKKSKI